MSEAKFTPGPWEYGPAGEEPNTYLFGARGLLFGRVVGSPGRDAEADARLICDAPRLLRQHVVMRAALAVIADAGEGRASDLARDALAEAEGGT